MLYLGPESVAPLASILAAVGGAFLLFWRQVKSAVQRVGSWFGRT